MPVVPTLSHCALRFAHAVSPGVSALASYSITVRLYVSLVVTKFLIHVLLYIPQVQTIFDLLLNLKSFQIELFDPFRYPFPFFKLEFNVFIVSFCSHDFNPLCLETPEYSLYCILLYCI